MKSKGRYLIILTIIILLAGGYVFAKSRLNLVLNNQDFNHKAYSFVNVDDFFRRVDNNASKYEDLNIFIINTDGSQYNIKTDIKDIYKSLDLELESNDLIPVTKDFKIKYVASNKYKSIEEIEAISLVDDKEVVLYDYQKEKVLNNSTYTVENNDDLGNLLNFQAYLIRFDKEDKELNLEYGHSINLERNGDYKLNIFNIEDNFSKEVIVTVKKSELIKENPKVELPPVPPVDSGVTGKLKNINVLVNKQYHLGSGDVPSLARVPANYALNSSYFAHPKAVASFIEMVDTMEAEIGKRIIITSAYRSYQYQKDLFNRYVARDGLAAAERYSARPGQSEHQTGLAIDVSVPNDSFLNFGGSPQSQWINNNAHRFGFIVRFQEGKEGITGYMPEPWHLRYLEPDLATKVFLSKLTYDEYYLAYLQ